MQDFLLQQIMEKMQDGVSYFEVEYDVNWNMVYIYLFDGSKFNHQKLSIVEDSVVKPRAHIVKFGPFESWVP